MPPQGIDEMTSKGPMNILIMTATITPKADVRSLGRKDPALRRKDYEDALWFYGKLVGQCIDRIVFVENSESDLSSLEAIAQPNQVLVAGPTRDLVGEAFALRKLGDRKLTGRKTETGVYELDVG